MAQGGTATVIIHVMPIFCMIELAEVGNFRGNPRFHPTLVGWNLGLTREFPTSAEVMQNPKIVMNECGSETILIHVVMFFMIGDAQNTNIIT